MDSRSKIYILPVTQMWVNLLELVVEVTGESGGVCWDSVRSKQVERGCMSTDAVSNQAS